MDYTRTTTNLGFVLFAAVFFKEAITECLPPFIPMNGTYHEMKRQYFPGDEITYTCDKGFLRFGEPHRTCLLNRSWTNQMPFCDYPIVLQNPTVEGTPKSTTKPQNITDKKVESCFKMEHVGQGLRIPLRIETVVHTVRFFLPKGKHCFRVEVSLGNGLKKKYCGSFAQNLEQKQWISIPCRDKVVADSICIREENNSKYTKSEICEVEVYGYEGSSCREPPNHVYVPFGQLIINRKMAIMRCDASRNRTLRYLVCEGSKWKGYGQLKCKEPVEPEKNNKDHSSKIVIIASVVSVCLILIGVIVALVFIYKRRQNPVIVMLKSKECYYRAGCATAPEEAEYATVIYDAIPLTPVQMRKFPKDVPPNLPDLLKEYGEPFEEANGNARQNPEYVLPQDTLSSNDTEQGRIKVSSFYGR